MISVQATILHTIVTVNEPNTTNTPPVAVISSSTAIGQAPLPVNFDGFGSSDGDGTITNYAWIFGDGTTSSGGQISHTYTTGGTFNPTLTVTDNGGLTNSASTPVIVTPPNEENQQPVAVLSLQIAQSRNATILYYNGLFSSDPDGTIAAYLWNFGDGKQSTKAIGKYFYREKATYTITLEVTDNLGLSSDVVSYSLNLSNPDRALMIEPTVNKSWLIPILNLILFEPAPQPEEQEE